MMRGVVHQDQMGQKVAARQGGQSGDQKREVEIGEYVTVDDEKRLSADERKRIDDATCGLQGLRLAGVLDAQPEPRAISESLLDLFAQPGMIDDDTLEQSTAELFH